MTAKDEIRPICPASKHFAEFRSGPYDLTVIKNVYVTVENFKLHRP